MANKISYGLGYVAVLSLLFARSTLCDQAPETSPLCMDVVSNTAPCLPYISNTSPSPTDICCTGIKNVAGMAKTHADKAQICNCLKAKVAGFNYNPSLIAALPKLCSVNIILPPINASTECTKIKWN